VFFNILHTGRNSPTTSEFLEIFFALKFAIFLSFFPGKRIKKTLKSQIVPYIAQKIFILFIWGSPALPNGISEFFKRSKTYILLRDISLIVKNRKTKQLLYIVENLFLLPCNHSSRILKIILFVILLNSFIFYNKSEPKFKLSF